MSPKLRHFLPTVDERRFQIQYLQQVLAVQTAQIANITAIYGVLLAIILFLMINIGAPIVSLPWRIGILTAYILPGLWLLGLVAGRGGELYDAEDPLASGVPVKLTPAVLKDTHEILDAMVSDNEETLKAKHRTIIRVVLLTLFISCVGWIIDTRQGAQPQPVVIVTPSVTPTATPTKQASPTPEPTPTHKATPSKKPHPSPSPGRGR